VAADDDLHAERAMLTPSSKIKRNGDLLHAQVGNEVVMMSIEAGAYFGVTDVGKRIWELVEQPTTVADLCARLVREYNVGAEECEAETLAFLDDLERQGIIHVLT
jgi:hypothetical protein